jgi:hypothetical protein
MTAVEPISSNRTLPVEQINTETRPFRRTDFAPIKSANAAQAYGNTSNTNLFSSAEAREAMLVCGSEIKWNIGGGVGCNPTTAWLSPFENPGMNRHVGGNVESRHRAYEDVTQGFQLIA